jgi:outer membrane protein assembly factor BamB
MKALFTFCFILLVSIQVSEAQAPTRWRGPNGNGTYNETGLLKQWPAAGPELLWSYTKLGSGYSSPAFANNLIYLSGMEGSTGMVYCLSDNGTLKWKAAYGQEWDSSYPGSRATPVIAGDHVYILSGIGDLACLQATTGNVVWKKNLVNDFGGVVIEWGLNETVVIQDNKLYCTPGGSTHNIIALDRFTGKLLWSCKGMGEKSAYCTPLLIKSGNRNLLVTHMAGHIIGVDADKGTMLWNYPHPNRWSVHPNTPLFQNNQLFCFSGYGQGGVMLQLSSDGGSVTKLWSSTTIDSRTGGAVLLNGKIYGSGDNTRDWQCIDWLTGKTDYSFKSIGNGDVIAAEGLLYWYSQRGELALVKPGTSSFEILGQTKISAGTGEHWAHPVIDKGRLFVRHGNTFLAYKIK